MPKHKRKKPKKFKVSDLVDWWSIPHFMFGVVTALITIVFSFPELMTLYIMLFLAVVWEVMERKFKLAEAAGNPAFDVFLPLSAFALTFFLVDRTPLNHEHHVGLLAATLVLYAIISLISWRARYFSDPDFLG